MTAARFVDEGTDLQGIAREADVDVVMTGTLLREGDRLRATAQLVSVPDGTILSSDRIDVSITQVIRLQDELTERIVDSLALSLTAREQESLRRDTPASAKAYELYLRGNHFFYDGQNWTIARDLFVESVKEDPKYAPAWARLGRCYRLTAKFGASTVDEMRGHLKRADVAFRKAFHLNADLPIAHQLYTAVETDLGRAEDAMVRLLRRAQRRRNDPELYAGLVHACRYCGLLEASVAAHEKALALDPQINTSVAQTFWMAGEYERALECRDALGGFFAGLPLVSLGRHAEATAAAAAQSSAVRDPTTRSYQRILPLLLEGRTDECLRLLDALAPRNPDPESVFYIARTYARLGAMDAAVVQFARAVDMGFFCVSTFDHDPWLDPLRVDPKFGEALSRARTRRASAASRFTDSGGNRLLGLDQRQA